LDISKDQTYFLYALTQEQLSHTIFPLGEYTKNEVRKIARSRGLRTHERPESQDFISGGNYSSFFRSDEIKEGDIVNENGDVLGRHKGVVYYTIGQRKGLGISSPMPVYVSKIEAEKNRIVVCNKESLLSKGLMAENINFISIDTLTAPRRVKVKIRFQHEGAFATLSVRDKKRIEVIFEEPQLSVTPGQSAVFYEGDTVIGGGIIERAIK
jgi:tRNA-specific 2-thiouridylase